MYIGNYGMSIHNQLGLKGGQLAMIDDQAGAYRTHIEDNKNSVEFGIPSGNRLLVIPRVKESRDCIALALFDDLILDFRNSPAIEIMVGVRT